MTREEIDTDLAQWEARRDELKANANAAEGIVAYLKMKLAALVAAPTTPAPDPPPT